jgi:GntR family transcriptional regulator
MILKIDLASEKPLYIQLKEQIIEGIALGLIKAGDSLPSVRQMAVDLGINLHTVNKAYSILQKEGFLNIQERKPVIVNLSIPKVDKKYQHSFPKLIRPIIAEAFCKGVNETEFLEKCKEIFLLFKEGNLNEL